MSAQVYRVRIRHVPARPAPWVRYGCAVLIGFALGVLLAQASASVVAPVPPGGPSASSTMWVPGRAR